MMRRQKAPASTCPAFPDIQESRARLGGALRGKTVVVVTEGRYLNNESKLLSRTLEAVGADVFHRRPSHSTLDKAALAWRAWRWPAP